MKFGMEVVQLQFTANYFHENNDNWVADMRTFEVRTTLILRYIIIYPNEYINTFIALFLYYTDGASCHELTGTNQYTMLNT
jgi:hypothetical protein